MQQQRRSPIDVQWPPRAELHALAAIDRHAIQRESRCSVDQPALPCCRCNGESNVASTHACIELWMVLPVNVAASSLRGQESGVACGSPACLAVLARILTYISDFVDVQVSGQRDVTMLAEVAGEQMARVSAVSKRVRHAAAKKRTEESRAERVSPSAGQATATARASRHSASCDQSSPSD